jgi:hypothetical protein
MSVMKSMVWLFYTFFGIYILKVCKRQWTDCEAVQVYFNFWHCIGEPKIQ